MTHKRKDCMERPRKVGAKYSGTNILPDEYVQKNLSLSFDGKRDRWSGYDPSEHRTVIEEFQKVEDAKRTLKAQKLDANEDSDEVDEDKDEDKYVDEVDMPGTKVDSKQRITVRNLRIREDTAKYLRNLDLGSAYYDPKTRSMRENPNPGKDDIYLGENFVRLTGDTINHAKAQLFAWEAHGKGVDVHLLAEPTKLELLRKEYDKKKEQIKNNIKSDVLDRYGGEEHLEAPPKTLLLAQTEDYVEYSRSGKVIKGAEKQIIRSKYEEDIYINNHTSVWGSFWKDGQWGYQCCHSFIKSSYCLGEVGKNTTTATEYTLTEKDVEINNIEKTNKSHKEKDHSDEEGSSSSSETDEEAKADAKEKESKKKHKNKKKKDKKRKHKEKQKEESKKVREKEKWEKLKAEEYLNADDRKRPYNSMYEAKQPTEEEMEEYFRKRKRDDDPMNQFL